jgi:hypothetical protein
MLMLRQIAKNAHPDLPKNLFSENFISRNCHLPKNLFAELNYEFCP